MMPDLSGAHLSGAYLSPSVWVDGGINARRNHFGVLRLPDAAPLYRAGCREWPSLGAALGHYGAAYAARHGEPARAEGEARLRLAHVVALGRGWPVA